MESARIEQMLQPEDRSIEIPFAPETSWPLYLQMKSLAGMGISALPYSGGLLDQPEWLMDDFFTFASNEQEIRNLRKKDR